jgi:hypothetical protein
MFATQVSIPTDADIAQLETWRRQFVAAELELPEGYVNEGVATAVARTQDGRLLGSLTGTLVTGFSLDPLLLRPGTEHKEALAGLFALTNTLEYQAQLNGAAASLVAIPDLLPAYQHLIKKCGFKQTAEFCKIYRRSYR